MKREGEGGGEQGWIPLPASFSLKLMVSTMTKSCQSICAYSTTLQKEITIIVLSAPQCSRLRGRRLTSLLLLLLLSSLALLLLVLLPQHTVLGPLQQLKGQKGQQINEVNII